MMLNTSKQSSQLFILWLIGHLDLHTHNYFVTEIDYFLIHIFTTFDRLHSYQSIDVLQETNHFKLSLRW